MRKLNCRLLTTVALIVGIGGASAVNAQNSLPSQFPFL
jgi:hypothetical protein